MKKVAGLLINIVTLIAVFLPCTGEGNQAIYGCYHKVTGLLRIVSGPSDCLPPEKLVSLSTLQPLDDIFVDCGAGQTVGDALAQAEDTTGPLRIIVKGVCTESVTINRDDMTLQGASEGDGLKAPDSAKTVLAIEKARNVHLQQLTLTSGKIGLWAFGGTLFTANGLRVSGTSDVGVSVNKSSKGFLLNVVIEDNYNYGVNVAEGSYASLTSSRVSGNGTDGVSAGDGSTISIKEAQINQNSVGVAALGNAVVRISFSTIEKNEKAGLLLWNNSYGNVFSTRIAENGSGVALFGGGYVALNTGTTVENNSSTGVGADGGSVIMLNSGHIINNGGNGVDLGDTSVIRGFGEAVISKNKSWGITCDGPPAVSQIVRGSQMLVYDNEYGDINCPLNP